MDTIFKWACILLLFVAQYNCDIFDVINEYVNKSGIIDGFFKPGRILGSGFSGAVWKGLIDQNKVDEIDRNKSSTSKQVDEKKVDNVTKKNGTTSSTPAENKSLKEKHLPPKSSTPTNTTNWKPIAMKIISDSFTWTFTMECRVFEKLLAYKNQTVERYGIPSVWYMGDILNKFHGIGMTLCDVSLAQKQEACGGKLNSINVLAVLYQALLSLKYIHGKEVFHNDLKSKNLVVKGGRLFIVDYNAATLFNNLIDDDPTIDKLEIMNVCFLEDLETMHNVTIYLACGDSGKEVEPVSVKNLLKYYIDEVTRLKVIKNQIFDYDAMGNKILDVIEKLSGGSREPLFTWLSNDEKSEAKKHLISIESVPGLKL